MDQMVHSGVHKTATHVTSAFHLSFRNLLRAYKWQRGLSGVRIKIKRKEFLVSGFQLGEWKGYSSIWSKAIHKDRRKQ